MRERMEYFAAVRQTPTHNGDGYGWGGDYIVVLGQAAINFGNDRGLAEAVAERWNAALGGDAR